MFVHGGPAVSLWGSEDLRGRACPRRQAWLVSSLGPGIHCTCTVLEFTHRALLCFRALLCPRTGTIWKFQLLTPAPHAVSLQGHFEASNSCTARSSLGVSSLFTRPGIDPAP